MRPRGRRLLALLAVDSVTGLLGAAILTLVSLGLIVAWQMLVGATTHGPVPILDAAPGTVTWVTVAGYALPGALLLFLARRGSRAPRGSIG